MRLHNRQVKASFWNDTDLIKNLTRDGRMFYQGLWQLADDSGCIDDDAFAWKIHLFPGDFDITDKTLTEFRNKLVEMKKLISYEADGKKCLYIKNFHKHQTLKTPAPPETPLPEWIEWQPYKSNPRTGKYIIHNLDSSYKVLTDELQSSSNQNQNQNQNQEPEGNSSSNNAREGIENDSSKELSSMAEAYHKYYNNLLNGTQAQSLCQWVEDGFNNEVIIAAMEVAAKEGIYKFAYLEGILRNWFEQNIRTMEDLEKAKERAESSKRGGFDNERCRGDTQAEIGPPKRSKFARYYENNGTN